MSRVCVLLVTAIMASLCGYQARADLTLSRNSFRPHPGDQVSCTCTVSGGETFSGWFKDNNRITTTTTATVHVVSSGSQHKLKFTQVRVADGGTYECRGSFNNPEKMTLEVSYDLSHVSHQQHIQIGKTDTIKLGVDGFPTPTFKWQKGDTMLDLNLPRFTLLQDGSLRINNVKLGDQGNYTYYVDQPGYAKNEKIEVIAVEYPKIEPFPSPYKYLTEDYPAYFVCKATGIPPPKYRWISPKGIEINTVGDYIKQGGNLTITKVSAALETGQYKCEAYIEIKGKEIKKDTASIDVKAVYVAPKITSKDDEENLNRGERFTLECRATGTPPLTVEWKRGGEVDPRQQKSEGQSIIEFLKIQVQDGGKYTCEARNRAVDSSGNNIVATMVKTINIKSPPYINTQASPGVIYSFLGNSAPTFVSCTFFGYPSPWVKMTFKGKLMSNATTTANASIKTDVKKNFGDYICYAKNEYGFKNHTVTLKEVGKPSEVRELKGTATCTAVTLTWKPPLQNGGMPINRYVLKVVTEKTVIRNIDGRKTSYTITNLKRDTSHNFVLRATNKGEWGPITSKEITTEKFCVPGRPNIYEPSVTNLDQNSFKLKWKRPDDTGGDDNIKYKIRYSDVSDNKEGPWKEFETKETEYEIKDLEPQKRYKFEVRAVNQAGESPPDERYYHTIKPGARGSQSRLVASLFTTLIVGILHLL